MSNDIAKFVEEEAGKINKSTRTMKIVGIVAIAVLTAYLSWIYTVVKRDFLNPTKLAQAAVGYASGQVPGLISDLQGKLLEQAPSVAKEATAKIKEILPSFRLRLQHEVEESLSLVPAIRKEAAEGVISYLRIHQEEIRELYNAHKDSGFAGFAVEATLKDLSENMFEEKGFNKESLTLLNGLAKQAEDLSRKPVSEMTDSEKQKAILLVSVLKNVQNFPVGISVD